MPGFVIAVDRGRYTLLVHEGGERVVTAMKARELGRKGVVVGDEVGLVGDISGGAGQPGPHRAGRAAQDRCCGARADDTDPVERIIVANADQLVIVTALADPEPRPRMIDRCLVAAYDAGMDPLLVLTKADLADPTPFLQTYAPLEVPHVVTSRDPGTGQWQGLEPLQRAAGRPGERLHRPLRRRQVHARQRPGARAPAAPPGVVNDVTGRGRHTSSSAIALRLPGGEGWVVDTPGVRSFGLAHVDPARIVSHFPDLGPAPPSARAAAPTTSPSAPSTRGSTPGRAGPAGPARLESLRRLLRARSPHPED